MKRILFIIITCFASEIEAQVGGEYTFSFLNLSENAKVASLGGDLISAFDSSDVNSGVYNPANIQENHSGYLGLNFLPLKQGILKTSASYTQKLNKVGLLNFHIQHIGYGEIQATNAQGYETGTINPQEYAFGVGKSWTKNYFRFGADVNFAGSNFGIYNAYALLADIGGTFVHPKKELTTSLLFKNIGIGLKPYVEGTPMNLPFQVQAGISFKPTHMPVRFNFTAHDLQQWDVQYLDPTNTFTIDNNGNKIPEEKKFTEKMFRHLTVGTEFILSQNLQFRVGYNHMRRKELKAESTGGTGFSFGGMIRIKRIGLEFSKAYYFAGSGSSVISLTTNLNKN